MVAEFLEMIAKSIFIGAGIVLVLAGFCGLSAGIMYVVIRVTGMPT